MAIDDLALLREYAQNNSQPAFTALVSRYVNLVYSIAFRRLGDRQLAEDVTQATFLILAQKAGSLDTGTIVSAWLCRTARFVASNALSSRRRRKHHEQKLAMRSVAKNSEAEAWEQIAPSLDTALAQLGKR